MRFKKKFPALIKSESGREYSRALGYKQSIVTGDYSLFQNYISFLSKPSEMNENALCLFSFGKQDDMFDDNAWEETHKDIFNSIESSRFTELYIKLHPSQNPADIKLLLAASGLKKKVEFIEDHPLKAATKFNYFITILTSAAQHASILNKEVCCYASKSMRDQVKQFGNDPYPYSSFKAYEISSKSDLMKWLNNTEHTKDNDSIVTKNHLLSLKNLCLKLNQLKKIH